MNFVWVLLDRERFQAAYVSAEAAMRSFERDKAWTQAQFSWERVSPTCWRLSKDSKLGSVVVLRTPIQEFPHE